MKKTILGLTVLMAVVSCKKNPENQVKDNVEKFMTEKMDDPKSYESVKFGKLDSLFSPFDETKEGVKLKQEEDSLSKRETELDERIDVTESIPELTKIQEESKAITARRSQIVDLMLEKSLKYKGNFIGFKTKHSFRGKNKMGALVLDSCTVIFDKNLEVKSIE